MHRFTTTLSRGVPSWTLAQLLSGTYHKKKPTSCPKILDADILKAQDSRYQVTKGGKPLSDCQALALQSSWASLWHATAQLSQLDIRIKTSSCAGALLVTRPQRPGGWPGARPSWCMCLLRQLPQTWAPIERQQSQDRCTITLSVALLISLFDNNFGRMQNCSPERQ